ncbi:MAG TPA: hypothetical protein VGC51_03360 [Hansschlegelia sp.]
MLLAKAIFGALVCLAVLSNPAAVSRPALAYPGTASAMQSPPLRTADREDERSCKNGSNTRQFGWKVVKFGVSTLKFVIGLLIIPVGLFLVCIGAVLEVVEWVAC